MSTTVRGIAGWMVLCSGLLVGCDQAATATAACDDAATEQACRECCRHAGAEGATWVDGECRCLSSD